MSTEHDPLEAFFRDAAPADPPEGLADRIVAAVGSPETRERLFWADVGQAARSALLASAAALLLSAGLVGMSLSEEFDAAQSPAQASSESESSDEFDLTSDSLERQMASSFMLLGEDQ